MRVLHVTDCYLPRLGGIEVHVSDLVSRQRSDGIDARVITATPAGPDLTGSEPPWVIRVGQRPARDDAARSVIASTADLRDLLRRWEPDVVHVHVSVFSPFATLAARHTSSRGLPTLVTVHSMWNRLGPLPTLAQGLLQLRRWPLTWTAVSDAAARPLREMLGPDIEVAVLPNAVDPDMWRPTVPLETTREPVPTLLSVMRFTRTKRALPLARMLRGVREALPPEVAVRATVIGDGPAHAAFTDFVRRHGMDTWVDLTGRAGREVVRDHLARADCFVAPARLESFGIAALEARAAGVPVVAASQSGVPEFIQHGRDGLLAADDDQMIRAIVRLVIDKRLRDRIAEHNRTVPITHDWTAALARTGSLYVQAQALTSPSRTRDLLSAA